MGTCLGPKYIYVYISMDPLDYGVYRVYRVKGQSGFTAQVLGVKV